MTRPRCAAHHKFLPCKACAKCARTHRRKFVVDAGYREKLLSNLRKMQADPAVDVKRRATLCQLSNRWQADENAILRNMGGKYCAGDVADAINKWRKENHLEPRTVPAVHTYAEKHGVSLNRDATVFSMQEVQGLLGCGRKRVKTFMQDGLLAHRMWGPSVVFDMSELEEFVRKYPWLVMADRMAFGPLRWVAENLTRRNPYLTVQQVAGLVGSTDKVVAQLAKSGAINAHLVPGGTGEWRVQASEIPHVREVLKVGRLAA